MDVEANLLETLRASGALKHGHFLLSSGRHSDQYVEKFDLLRNPIETSRSCALIANRFRDQAIDVVVGPTTGGILLAFEVARQLGVSAAYAERGGSGESRREIRRGTTFAPNARVLVVDDILTTGSSVRETLGALRSHPVHVIGVAVLVDRSNGSVHVGTPIEALAKMDIATWDASQCPLCASAVPLVKPGTTPDAPLG